MARPLATYCLSTRPKTASLDAKRHQNRWGVELTRPATLELNGRILHMNNSRDKTITSSAYARSDTSTNPRAAISSDPRLIQAIDPGRCRIWSQHPRRHDRVTPESCRSLIRSIAAHGQLVPVLARPACDHPQTNVEILCGSRRLFVSRHLGIPLLVQVRDLSNSEAAIAVEVENRVRKSLSPDERDFHFKSLTKRPAMEPRAGMAHPRDYDTVLQASAGKPLFTSRRYFNVLELVFPQALDDFTVEVIHSVIADILDPLARTAQARPPLS